jgi:hypothetical protein
VVPPSQIFSVGKECFLALGGEKSTQEVQVNLFFKTEEVQFRNISMDDVTQNILGFSSKEIFLMPKN